MSTSRIAVPLRLAVLATIAALPSVASAAPGDLDLTFGSGGRVVTSFQSFETGVAGALQPDGKIVVTGTSFGSDGIDVRVTRYDTSGALDASFGTGGTVTTDLGADEAGVAIAVQADMKIVVAANNGWFGSGPRRFNVVRYLPDGSLDPTFGTGGIVVTPIGDSAVPHALALQSDGKIIVAGEGRPAGMDDRFTLARYDVNGDLDAAFGDGGIVMTDIGFNDAAHALTIQPDGRIVAVGNASQGIGLARYTVDGDLDDTFGTGGVVITPVLSGASGEAVIRDVDGGFVVAGAAYTDHRIMLVARYRDDGTLDPGFGTDGVVTTSLGPFNQGDDLYALLRLPTGHYLVAGGTSNQGGGFALLEHLADGSLEPTFGNGGVVVTPMPPGIGAAGTILRQNDGKLVAVGSTCYTDFVCIGGECYPVPYCRIALARYEGYPCGSGTIEPGEECDDGNALDGDCCSATCVLDAAGTACEQDGTICTAEVCDGAGGCEQQSVRMPATCDTGLPGASRVLIKDKPNDASDGLTWKWKSASAVTLGDLGDPFTHGYTLCVVDDAAVSPTLRVASAAPSAGTCSGKPCWKTSSTGLSYRDKQLTPDGLSIAKLKAGSAGKAKHLVKGKGAALALPALPWTPPVIVRLHRDDDPNRCWEATFSTPKKNEPGTFKASSD